MEKREDETTWEFWDRKRAHATELRCDDIEAIDPTLTVGEIIEQLQKLPPDTPVLYSSYCGHYPLSITENLFLVYLRGDVLQLHIDDGQATHGGIEHYQVNITEYDPANNPKAEKE